MSPPRQRKPKTASLATTATLPAPNGGAQSDPAPATAETGGMPHAIALQPARTRNQRQVSSPAVFFDLSASIETPSSLPRGPQLAHTKPASVEIATRLPPLTEIRRFNTTRLLPAKYSESVLTRIAETDEDLQLIFALENATNERLLAEQNLRLGITARELVFHIPHYRIINAAFTHPHPQGGRFSLPYRGAWYAGFELATARAEVLFHRMLQFAEIRWNAVEELDYDQYLADFCGSFHDLRPEAFGRTDELGGSLAQPPAASPLNSPSASKEGCVQPILHAAAPALAAADFSACLDPRSYIASQQLTLELLEAGSCGILYPSTRKPSGHNIACFRPSLVCNVRKRDLYRLTWYPDRAATFLRCARTTSFSTTA